MERLPAKSGGGAVVFLLLSGCTHLDTVDWSGKLGGSEPVCQVVATWTPEVMFSPDPTKGGAPQPGLAGRVYLFGSEVKTPLVGNGTLVVDLYDDAPLAQGKPAMLLEEWRFNKETLKTLCHKDAIGWGYTVFLPWGTYRPEITQVHLQMHYDAPGVAPLYSSNSSMVLNHGLNSSTKLTERKIRPEPGQTVAEAMRSPK
jgi:hypothetical protein